MSKELFDAVQMLAQEKGIPEDYLYEKISAAIVVAAKHDYNGKDIATLTRRSSALRCM